jgi:hypothetical protein
VEIAGSVGQKGCSQGKTHGWLRQEEKADMILCYCFHLFVVLVLYSTPFWFPSLPNRSSKIEAFGPTQKRYIPSRGYLFIPEPTDRQPSNPEDEDMIEPLSTTNHKTTRHEPRRRRLAIMFVIEDGDIPPPLPGSYHRSCQP